MNPVNFSGTNKTLNAPAGMEGTCDPLHVYCDGKMCISCWEPTPEERAAIAAGQPIYLYVFSGETQPPVGLAVITPEPMPAAKLLVPATQPEPSATSDDGTQTLTA